jgi:hypothetical protein
MTHLLEGALSFVKNGVEFVVPYGAEKWDKSGFSIDDGEGQRIWLPLLQSDIHFNVHRDIFQGQEWEVFMEDPE